MFWPGFNSVTQLVRGSFFLLFIPCLGRHSCRSSSYLCDDFFRFCIPLALANCAQRVSFSPIGAYSYRQLDTRTGARAYRLGTRNRGCGLGQSGDGTNIAACRWQFEELVSQELHVVACNLFQERFPFILVPATIQ